MSISGGKIGAHTKTTIPALEYHEKLFRVLVENSSDAIALVSTEGAFTYVSPVAQKILGYTPEELLGRSPRELFPPNHIAEVLAQFQVVVERPGLTVTVEHPYLHKDGSVRWIESTTTNYLHEPTIQAYVANFRDITERKRTEEKQRVLNEASNFLVSSLDHQITLQEIAGLIVPTLADYCRIAILDDNQQIKEISVNHIDPEKIALVRALYEQYKDRETSTHGLQRILETGASELISTVASSVLEPAQDNPELISIVQALDLRSYMGVPLIARGKTIGAITFSSVQPDRRYTRDDLLFAQELARRIALALDNTRLYQQAQGEIREREKAQEALKESEAHKVAVFDTALDSIITMDYTGKVIEFNPAAERMFGYPHHEAIGRELAELIIPPSLREVHRRGLAHYLATGEGAMINRQTEIMAMRKDGSEFPIELAITRVPKAGYPMFTGTIRDISERKELEQRKDEFISMASHELKTPVTSLKGFTNLIQRRLTIQADEKALHYLARIDSQLNKLSKLITDLLDISKIQTGKLTYLAESFDLDALVKETIENLQAASDTHQLHVVEEVTNVPVVGDRDRVGQVLINLVSNALKYSPQADTVIIRVATDSINALVSVQDFGIGIAKEHQQKIFERFYQVTDPEEKTYPGLGIGLYLSCEIIKRHGGNLWVESRKGRGSTFHFTLPLLERKRPEQASAGREE